MAFKLRFNLPSLGSLVRRGGEALPAVGASARPDKGSVEADATTGKLTVIAKLQLLGALAVIFFSVSVFALWQEIHGVEVRDAQQELITEMRVFVQVISKNAIRVTTHASTVGFAQLRSAHQRFQQILGLLRQGGEDQGQTIVALGSAGQTELEALGGTWNNLSKSLTVVLAQENGLKALAVSADKADQTAAAINKLADDIPALQDAARAARDVARRARAILMLPAPQYLEAFEVQKRDMAALRSIVRNLGGVDAQVRETLDKTTGELEAIIAAAGENIQALDEAKKAGSLLLEQSDLLATATEKLAQAVSQGRKGFSVVWIVIPAAIVLVLLILMLKLFHDSTNFQRLESERQRRQAEAAKDATQEAILRLMNEMGDLADGDLTVRATVTEDITGAIADSVNYTIEELSVLVRRINDAAGRVTVASAAAEKTSSHLLAASEKQSHEIQEAGQQVLAMAQSMTEVSGRALESAQVARRSLDAARKGAQAVSDSISGMNEIRSQIQETSKRIKRLGESSQEIGEIVELISDITEQTNVLALNAAIQAASAGEAGRGFSVVAEEVQRLAERSGEATKQIAAIVKAIQADTHDAVAAMENSTRDVVAGAQLSDAAGQALAEISSVSQQLAQLIENISTDTQHQAEVARHVAGAMRGILRITEQTTAGTQETAGLIRQLADLAVELKGSVAGFKV